VIEAVLKSREVAKEMKTTVKNLALTAAAAAMLLAAPAVQAANDTKKDMSEQVRHELVMLPYFSIFDNLGYRVDGNVVTLYGYVTRPVLKSDAQNVVKRVEGVARVINNIEVLPLSPMDDRIRVATARAIYGYGPMQRYGLGTQPPIRIIVKNGNVTLEGVVDNQADKNIAGIRANGVPGVFSVTNDLRVGG
jgi:hyperosmotically inducible protein